MKTWTRPRDLRAKVQVAWDRGEFLAAFVSGEQVLPRRFPIKGPTSAEMTESFGEVREWVAELSAMPGFRLEMREVVHRVLGANAIPSAAWLDSLDDALSLIGKKREAARFQVMVEVTRARQPGLLEWLTRRPLRALDEADNWTRLLDIVAWMQAHPRPGIFLRQVDIPGVHSKFIEAHRGLLSELFDLVLPAGAIDVSCTKSRFADRYGFRDKPDRVRFRVLDPALRIFAGGGSTDATPDAISYGISDAAPASSVIVTSGGTPDVTLDAVSFAALELAVRRVFVTENETNFLAFPNVAGGIAIFGAGYGWDALARARWLTRCPMLYWGDIDTHGFAILDQLRGFFPQTESFLMDRETLLSHRPFWTREKDQTVRHLSRLTPAECALYDDLRDNRLGDHIRLEQEMVGFGVVQAAGAPSSF